jgi:uncharacterized membrane protein YcaP (DUF421 family)
MLKDFYSSDCNNENKNDRRNEKTMLFSQFDKNSKLPTIEEEKVDEQNLVVVNLNSTVFLDSLKEKISSNCNKVGV